MNQKSKTFFVAGTDTGVGKTLITGLLAYFFLKSGRTVVTQKWIETGSRGSSQDLLTHLRLMKKTKNEYRDYLSHMSPYVFTKPTSPHLACRLDKRRIDSLKIIRSFEFLQKLFDISFIEGSGGIHVPIHHNLLFVDIVKRLKLPVILVARNQLGAINHTLLTIEALKRRKIKCYGVIYSTSDNKSKKEVLCDNPKIIERYSQVKTLGVIPYMKKESDLYQIFKPIAQRIIRCS